MLIRDAQFGAFSDDARRRFIETVMAGLTKALPETCSRFGPALTEALVEKGIHTAAAYGITGQEAVERFVQLTFIFGQEFEWRPDFPGVALALSDASLDQDTKMNYVTKLCFDETARQRSNQTT
jgi:hypothetical protein